MDLLKIVDKKKTSTRGVVVQQTVRQSSETSCRFKEEGINISTKNFRQADTV